MPGYWNTGFAVVSTLWCLLYSWERGYCFSIDAEIVLTVVIERFLSLAPKWH